MVKPRKNRQVMQPPFAVYFKPQGIPLFLLQHTILMVDEYEAIRLADHEGLKHDEASQKMNISRPTFTRLLDSAHKKTADALVNGKAIKIEGGNYVLLNNRFYCNNCGHIWNIKPDQKLPVLCPQCKSNTIIDLNRPCGHGYGHGRRGRR